MWLSKIALGVPLLVGACAAPTTPTASPMPSPGSTWAVQMKGSATPSPTPSIGTGSYVGGLPSVSFLPLSSSACVPSGPPTEHVLIPLVVTPQKGALTVEWPAQYGSIYRLTAINQVLVNGTQPPPTWQTVPAGTGCTVTATIAGLISGGAYIVWLDAPDSGHNRDGSRHLYTGRSAVVHPL